MPWYAIVIWGTCVILTCGSALTAHSVAKKTRVRYQVAVRRYGEDAPVTLRLWEAAEVHGGEAVIRAWIWFAIIFIPGFLWLADSWFDIF